MSGHLFDTCVVRKWFAKDANVEARVLTLAAGLPLYISCVTLGEIEFGHTHVAANDLAKQAAFRKWMRDTFELPQLEITDSTALEYAKFRRRLFDKFTRVGKYSEQREDKLGQQVGVDENDLWLVAQACERNLSFVTLDHMNRIKEIANSDVRITVWPPT